MKKQIETFNVPISTETDFFLIAFSYKIACVSIVEV